jgi:dihydroorotate dehydrogenase electron transfer subunit
MDATCANRRTGDTAGMTSVVTRVLENERVEGGCHRVLAEVEGAWPGSSPGQFTMLSTDHPRFPLLPRPFSLLGSRHENGKDLLEWMIMPVGVGTAILCSLSRGEAIHVVGPLGGSMTTDLPDGPPICVAGGYGVAPFIYLLEQWRAAGDPRADEATVVFGARTAERLSLASRLESACRKVELCTDDGTRGFHGRVDARLAELLDAGPAPLVLTCGPDPMMEAVGRLCRERGVPARASLETVMGCGYAVCNGCAVAVEDPSQPDGYTYELACREGTVFDESRLQWHQA